MQLDPLEFIEKIAAFIPYPRRHRHHYHGAFAPNSSLRKKVAASAGCYLEQISPSLKEGVGKIRKVSFDWAKLIARIYENPLICSGCGGKIKIIAFVTHTAEIQRILKRIGWPTVSPGFDPPYDLLRWDFCQLIPNTKDGFPEMEIQTHWEAGPDPPSLEGTCDPPHCTDYSDPPHWSD
jgi:Putative transposase